jgi:prepilin-type N-terminal cleavage/methylation domain-containing protein
MSGCHQLQLHKKNRSKFLKGFSLLELIVVLVVLGVLVSVSSVLYLGLLSKDGGVQVTDAKLKSLSGSVIAFVKTHHRLPCPDNTGSGYEALNAGVCTSGVQVGWLPYVSMGLSPSSANERAIYGVYRSGTADLAVSTTVNILTGAASAVTNSNIIYLTGDGTTTNGSEDCVNNIANNPAYIILAPGEDRDGNGSNVDGVNQGLPSGRCFSAPSRGINNTFDDRTISVSLYALLAELNK